MLKNMVTVAAALVLVSVVPVTDAIAAGHGGKVARGRTGQGRHIRVKLMPGKIKIQGFSIELHCSGGYLLVDQESGFQPTSVNRSGHLRDRQYGSTDEVLIRGHLRGRTLRGQVRVRDRLGKHHCSSPWIRFTAKARR